jgi:hypothetical protein
MDTRESLFIEFQQFLPRFMRAVKNRHDRYRHFHRMLRQRDELQARLRAVLEAGG